MDDIELDDMNIKNGSLARFTQSYQLKRSYLVRVETGIKDYCYTVFIVSTIKRSHLKDLKKTVNLSHVHTCPKLVVASNRNYS